MNMEDNQLVITYCTERGLKARSQYGYLDTLNKFINFTNRNLTNSLKLYEKEEEQGVRWKHCTLKNELLSFRNWLYSQFLGSTARTHFQKICTFLRHYEIEIGHIPKVNNRNVNNYAPLTFNDLLTHEELKQIISNCNGVMKALITFMVSSGSARKEALSLTVEDYLKANNQLINSNNIKEVIMQVNTNQIPMFRLKRFKTNKFYYTFCTPQANEYIKQYLIHDRKHLELDSQLFKINHDYLNTNFRRLNEELNLGTVRNMRRCRSHMFRKYNASTLFNNGMDMADVDCLQGRGKDSTHRAYFMEDPNLLKRKYEQYVEVLTI